jgi:hypothetical protein
MPIDTLTFDAVDPLSLANFWAMVLGYRVIESWDEGDDAGALIAGTSGWRLIFVKVPEAKAGKNRLHLDLTPLFTRDAEVSRLVEIGATVLEGYGGPEATWTVLQDPEGNEFCVLHGPGDQQKQPAKPPEGGDA